VLYCSMWLKHYGIYFISVLEGIEQILEAHPRLTRKAIQAALAFAAEALRADVVYPLEEAAGEVSS
jgi:uncharacterized protein YjeT (DUF2065 family)